MNKCINQNFTYNNDGRPQPIRVDYCLTGSNCIAYFIKQTMGAESNDEASRIANLFTDAPGMLNTLRQLVETLQAGCKTKKDKEAMDNAPIIRAALEYIIKHK